MLLWSMYLFETRESLKLTDIMIIRVYRRFKKRLILFTALSPQEHRDLKLDVTSSLYMWEGWARENCKVGPDWGLNCTWIGPVLGPIPLQAVYKVTFSCQSFFYFAKSNYPHVGLCTIASGPCLLPWLTWFTCSFNTLTTIKRLSFSLLILPPFKQLHHV